MSFKVSSSPNHPVVLHHSGVIWGCNSSSPACLAHGPPRRFTSHHNGDVGKLPWDWPGPLPLRQSALFKASPHSAPATSTVWAGSVLPLGQFNLLANLGKQESEFSSLGHSFLWDVTDPPVPARVTAVPGHPAPCQCPSVPTSDSCSPGSELLPWAHLSQTQ